MVSATDLPKSPFAPAAYPVLQNIEGVEIFTGASHIKNDKSLDTLLVKFPENTSVAGVFTKSKTRSAAVDYCKNSLKSGKARAFLCNSGNSNAFTGAAGQKAVDECASALNLPKDQIFIASTGVIGVPLPYEKITKNLGNLKPSSWLEAAQAISTTDTYYKLTSRKVGGAVINGIAKGSGMIAPDMATMICQVATNAEVASSELQKMLSEINAKTFNCITVDSDTSTSDTLLVFATNKVKVDLAKFKQALFEVIQELALLVVKDGEGAQKLITVNVKGAKSDEAAHKIAMSIANSPLIKTAVAGEDANWGRVVMAVGKSGEEADRDKLSIWFDDILVAKNGAVAAGYDEAKTTAHLKTRDVKITADIGLGSGTATVYTCDLTHGYISINADYRS
jgi:glutamate N-acetyltransferase/amino-acid N-acetyltransferase